MDACARIKGIPLKSRATLRKETVRENAAVCVKTLLKNRRELCSVFLELQHIRSTQCPTEINFVCLPSHTEGEDLTTRVLPCGPPDMAELLRSLHVHSLKNEEVLLLKDSKKILERKDSLSQTSLSKAICIFRHSHASQINVTTLLGLLTRYTAGIRYALELQSLQRGMSESGQTEDDDTNHSVSSIEEDFVTAFEHLEEEENGECSFSASCSQRNQRDVASQTVSRYCKDMSGSHIIIGTSSKKSSRKQKYTPEGSISVQLGPTPACFSGNESQSRLYMSDIQPKVQDTPRSPSESDESNCSSPSPIIFLDEVDYQKSLKAKLDIPQIPVLKDGVEDSDSEVSEFFDSFDQFEDLDLILQSSIKVPKGQITSGQSLTKKSFEDTDSKYVYRGYSTMNPHKFDHSILPDNIRKPTPLKPGSPYGVHSDVPDSPRLVRTSCDDSGALFSPVCSSAFSPLGEGATLECFWKSDGDVSELRKPQDLCSLYKTYSDFASNLSKEILGSVCGYPSPIDMNMNKNLSCVCHKEFKSISGHLMKLADIQETVTVAKSQQKYQSLKNGIQRFATDLVEISVGSALRDIQKGVSSCTTTLCHLAARLTSSVFQMAFHEIGMRRAYVLKERAINGLAGFLVGEAVSGALRDFLSLKSQIFNNTVTQFAADLAEELVFEGIMEVCQFSHPSTPLTPKDYSFEQQEEVVSSYATDLSESVLQEAFIELSQADIAFTTQAAISVSVDNICHVSSEESKTTCSTTNNSPEFQGRLQPSDPVQEDCTMQKALYCVSGMASSVSVPVAGKAISDLQSLEETADTNTNIEGESDTVTVSLDDSISGRTSFNNMSGTMVDKIVSEAFDLMTSSKVKKRVEDCAEFLSRSVGSHLSVGQGVAQALHSKSHDAACQSSECNLLTMSVSKSERKETCDHLVQHQPPVNQATSEADPVLMKDTLDVPIFDGGGRKIITEETLHGSERTCGAEPSAPSTPQQPLEVCNERKNKQFSKRFKGKFTKELSPSTLPSTSGQTEASSDSDKADLMHTRSSSEETCGMEEEVLEGRRLSGLGNKGESEHDVNLQDKMMENGALLYAGRLAYHIVSMATEMDSMGVEDILYKWDTESKDVVSHCAKFSEQTLNVLWMYAGEIAGEVMSDVKKMMITSHCQPEALQRGTSREPQSRESDCKTERLSNMADKWSSDCLTSVLNAHSSSSSGMSSEYPSCESVSDEYAGYLIKVLKKEGGSRELILDHYASQLACRSIKAGLTHAARKLKQKSPLRLYSLRHLHCNSSQSLCRMSASQTFPTRGAIGKACYTGGAVQPLCDDDGQDNKNEYMEFVNFAESLAYSITCDVTRKLRVSSVRLPKSLTDSCLYKKNKFEDKASESFTTTTFSCSILPNTEQKRQYHSTGSLNDSSYNNGIMQVIEHYAQKIVDDTLDMTLGTVAQQQSAGGKTLEKLSCSERLWDADGRPTSACQACHHCQVSDCLCYGQSGGHHYQGMPRRGGGQCLDAASGLDIPKIHIHLDKRAMFAEDMVSTAIAKAKKELSSTSLNADSGIGHDGASLAESLTTEIMTSALSNVCQTINLSTSGKEAINATESTISQQLSVGDDSLGSWSNLSFEDDHPDESSSFFHLSDSNGNSSSWSSLGLEGEVYEERLSFSPSDSDCTDEKELEIKEESNGAARVERVHVQGERALLVINTELREPGLDPQLRSLLQWIAASIAELPVLHLGHHNNREIQQLPEVMQKVKERQWRIGELLQALLRYYEESQLEDPALDSRMHGHKSLFQWLLEQA
ncbi:A-kinase anchor protein 11 isoform X2 [Clupea harengus]|uniref:A-kinase anchor protein 11 isoform X2 n=1 Tax=Clupea harengus TaxID=7950 RepID=A0A6P8EXH3_CLUHA|nr:A-kinase anchor protein 11 isoform X2 [Clupea harengus]